MQFQATDITPSSSTAILAQSDNPTACFTSRVLNIWIIDNSASDHIMENKYILHDLSSPLSFATVILANGTPSVLRV